MRVDGTATLELGGTTPATVSDEGGVVLGMNDDGGIVAYTTCSVEAEQSDILAADDTGLVRSTDSVSSGRVIGAIGDGESSFSGDLAGATATESKMVDLMGSAAAASTKS